MNQDCLKNILLLIIGAAFVFTANAQKYTPLDSFFQKNYDSTFMLDYSAVGGVYDLYIVARQGRQTFFFRYNLTQNRVNPTPGLDYWVTKELDKFRKALPDTNRYFSVRTMNKYSFWQDVKLPRFWNITDTAKAHFQKCGTVDDGSKVAFTMINRYKIVKRYYNNPFHYARCDPSNWVMNSVTDLCIQTIRYFKNNDRSHTSYGGPGSLRIVKDCDVQSW